MKNIIITMAGLGSRFTQEGYNCPKYEIRLFNGDSLFSLSIKSLINLIEKEDKIIFITRKENKSTEFIKHEMSKNFIELENYEIKEIDYLTDGQATTAYLAKDLIKNENDPIIIYNIDTYVEPSALKLEDIRGDGWIPCFNGKGDHWSFCKTKSWIGEDNIEDLDRVVEVAEKKRISPNCSIGLYYFSSFRIYENLYQIYKTNNTEKYIMPMYQYMLEHERPIYITSIPEDKVHCLGTPDELKEYEAKLQGGTL